MRRFLTRRRRALLALDSVVKVLHVGPVSDRPGGIAQVVRGYQSWAFPNVDICVATSNGRRRAITDIFRVLLVAGQLARAALTSPTQWVCVFHLSQRGSFIREGGLLLFSKKVLKLPTLAHLHGSEFVPFAERWPNLVRRVLRSADGVLFLSHETESALERLGIPPNRRLMVRNGIVVPPAPSQRAKRHTVVMAGVIGRRKGVDTLVQAWAQLPSTDWQLHLYGPLEDLSEAQLQAPGIYWHGSVEQPVVARALDDASIAVLLSRGEALPMFLLEAMARSCAVLTTPVGQLPTLSAAGAIRTVPVGCASTAAAELFNLMTDDEGRRELAERGREFVESHHSATTVAPALEVGWLTLARKVNR